MRLLFSIAFAALLAACSTPPDIDARFIPVERQEVKVDGFLMYVKVLPVSAGAWDVESTFVPTYEQIGVATALTFTPLHRRAQDQAMAAASAGRSLRVTLEVPGTQGMVLRRRYELQ
jgi:hypothetical protein